MKTSRKRITKWGAIIFGVYILAFFPLWLGGGYVLTESGRVRQFLGIQTGIAAPDVAEWQPLIGHFQHTYHWPTGRVSPRCDFIGWVYYPLWRLVRASHPSVQLLTDGGRLSRCLQSHRIFDFIHSVAESFEVLLGAHRPRSDLNIQQHMTTEQAGASDRDNAPNLNRSLRARPDGL